MSAIKEFDEMNSMMSRTFLSNVFCQQGVVDKFKRDFQLEVGGMSGDFCNMVAFDHLPEREFLKQLKVPPLPAGYICVAAAN